MGRGGNAQISRLFSRHTLLQLMFPIRNDSFPHSDVSNMRPTMSIVVVQDSKTQASKLSFLFRSDFAVFDLVFVPPGFVREVFAQNGPNGGVVAN